MICKSREILFRGKPIVEEELMEPNETLKEFFKRQHGWSDYGVNEAFTDDGFVIGQVVYSHKKAWIVGEVVEAEEDYIALEYWVPVKPETVGQYTGTDIFSKGFKGVYVGDLFQDESGTVLEVIFEDKIGAFGAWRKEDEWLSVQSLKMWCELVGNKWDNPELLEVLDDEA